MTTQDADPPAGNVLLRVFELVIAPPILTGFAGMLAVGSLVVIGAWLASLEGLARDGEVVTGDFLAFWTGAELVAQGRGDQLYDLTAQQGFQDALIGQPLENWIPYVNPPGFAMALTPLTALEPLTAFMVYGALSTLLLGGALWWVSGALLQLSDSRSRWTAVLLALAFQPVVQTALAGQNTAISLALLCGVFAAWRGGHPLVAGVALGLLSFKPQLGLLLGLAMIAGRQWRVVGAATGVVAIHLGAATWLLGPEWPLAYVDGLRAFRPLEQAAGQSVHISLLPGLRHIAGHDVGSGLAAVGGLVVAGLSLRSMRLDPQASDAGVNVAVLILASMLLTPHLYYYDAGLVVLPVLLLVDAALRMGRGGLAMRLALAAAFFSYTAFEHADRLGVQPLFLELLALFAWSVWLRGLRQGLD